MEEIDPHLAHSISRRAAILLQAVFNRSQLTHKIAVNILKSKADERGLLVDVENIPIDWKGVKEATRQLIGQAAMDKETFTKFSSRLDVTFLK